MAYINQAREMMKKMNEKKKRQFWVAQNQWFLFAVCPPVRLFTMAFIVTHRDDHDERCA